MNLEQIKDYMTGATVVINNQEVFISAVDIAFIREPHLPSIDVCKITTQYRLITNGNPVYKVQTKVADSRIPVSMTEALDTHVADDIVENILSAIYGEIDTYSRDIFRNRMQSIADKISEE